MKWYKVILAPVAVVYGAGVMLRNGLYKAKILRTHHVQIPTIGVGNLAVGGTGKTPFVEYLVEMLSKHYQVAVLSRGYGRKTHGFVLADKDATSLTIGDEPMQIHRKFPNLPVAVCKNRVEGIKRLQQCCKGLQVVVLDDALQYRSLKCGFNVLLTTYDRLYIDDHFLPMGRLRDARRESLRASAVVVSKCPETMRPIDQRIIDTKLHLPTFQQLYFSRIEYEDMPEGEKVLLVTGIAHPEYMLEAVRRKNPMTKLMAYRDHHRFSKQDIQAIAQTAEGYDRVLTTEKDYVRMMTMELPKELEKKMSVLRIRVSFTDAENLERQLKQYINENLQPKR